jgi:hypothetical protein
MIGLEHPWFLLGLAALAIPVLAHLMHRHISRRLVFPSTRFLRRAELPPEGRRRLRDLLLLLLRLVALAAVVLAFARPYVRPPADTAPKSAAAGRITVFLVDVSASMGTRGVADRALDLLRSELAALAPGERAGLVLSANRVVAALPPGTGPGALADLLAATPPRPVPGNHTAALREAAALLAGSGPRRLVVISDLQLPDWQDCRAALSAGTEVRLLNPADPALPNVALTGASVAGTAPGRCRVTIEVRNLSDASQERQVTVRVGQDRQTATVSLPPLQVRRVAFALKADDAVRGLAELSPDDYPADDTLHFWAGAPPVATVLAAVAGGEDAQGPDVQAFFLAKGLESSAAGAPSPFRVRTVSAEAFPATDLSSVPVVFVLGAADRFDQAAFEHLRRFCADGGTAVCTPGAFPGQMVHGLRANGLFDARLIETLGQTRQRGEAWNLGWVNPQGLLAECFADADSTDLFLFPIRQYLRLGLAAHQAVHLKTTGGDPVLAEQSVGRGRVLVLAIALETQWSDLPLSASFLPLVQEIARAAVPAGFGVTRLDCGQPLPEFRDLLGRPVTASGVPAEATAAPGVFSVGDRPVEVNVSRRESSPERINPFDLTRRLSGSVPATAPVETAGTVPGRPGPVVLWPVLALLAAGLFLGEMAWTLWTDHREIRGRMPASP